MEKQKITKDSAALRGIFIELIHRLLKTGEKYTYDQIGNEYKIENYEKINKDKRRYGEYHDSMHKAISDITRELKKNGTDLIREERNNRHYAYSYPNGASDIIEKWLDKKSQNKKKMRLTELVKLFAMSKGLLPDSWIVNLTPQIEGLEDEEIPTSKIIEFDFNDQLTNIYKIPYFIDAIKEKKVLSLVNNASYKYDVPIVFIPYYIKEYNHRFFCIGLCKKSDGTIAEDYVIAIDRVSKVKEDTEESYIPPTKDYNHFFEDIVGVRHEIDSVSGQPMKKQHILIETRDLYTHGRIASKPLHASQKVEHEFGKGKNGMGLVILDLVPNPELTSLLLGFSDNIRIIEPASLAERIANKAKAIAALYETSTDNKKMK